MVRFHKKNIYGRIDWELPGGDIRRIEVFAEDGRRNWILKLEVAQHQNLLFGDNAFAKMSQTRALTLAEKAGKLTGIKVEVVA